MIAGKADILFLVMGGNPFPNLISAATRISKGGRIICICTQETERYSYNRFKKLIKENVGDDVNIEKLMINKLNRRNIEEVLKCVMF